MGVHAFADGPAHCALYRALTADHLPPIYGVEARWNMPVARHRAELRPEAPFPGVDHYVLTYQIGRGEVRRLDRPDLAGVARSGALSLQQPGSGGVFVSIGPVDYAHLYFRQSLLCELGDSLGLGDIAEIGDFFALFDDACAADVSAYLKRAADRADPPTALEMDSRAYLLGLHLVRAARDRAALLAAHREGASGCDLRRVLELVEDRLGEPLRLSDLARAVGLSPFHFARVFRQRLGVSPAHYLMRRRTERAIGLIRGSDLPLAQIAFRTGFSSQAHMTRRVRAHAGHPPGAIRRAG